VDSCLRYDGSGNIVGRNGGIRAWIAENVPELSPRYKTIMRHKALAMRARQLTGLEDPQPTSVLLDGPADGRGENSDGEARQAFGTGANGRGNEDGKSSGTDVRTWENETENRNGTGKSEGPVGLENYYAHDSHFSRRRDGVMRKPDGQKRKSDELNGVGSKRGRLEQKRGRLGQKQERLERQQERPSRVLEQKRELSRRVPGQQRKQLRQIPGPQREQPGQMLEQKRSQLRRVLAECPNTFKDVFDRIDSELG
jgi:hypothetical protein